MVVVVTILFDYLYSFELMNLNVFIGLAVAGGGAAAGNYIV